MRSVTAPDPTAAGGSLLDLAPVIPVVLLHDLEAAAGGPIAKIRDGDLVTVDADSGSVRVEVRDDVLAARPLTGRAPSAQEWTGTGRELFAAFRRVVGAADRGASVFDPTEPAAVPTPSEELACAV